MNEELEELLQLIREQEDYKEEKFRLDDKYYNLIDFIDESSDILEHKVRTNFLYEFPEGKGRGTNLELIY